MSRMSSTVKEKHNNSTDKDESLKIKKSRDALVVKSVKILPATNGVPLIPENERESTV